MPSIMQVDSEFISDCSNQTVSSGIDSIYVQITNRRLDTKYPSKKEDILKLILKAKYKYYGC